MSKVDRQAQDYQGAYMEPLYLKKDRKKRYAHPIFLFEPTDDLDEKHFDRLDQVVNIYDHTLEDFEFNARKIIKHYKKNYGNSGVGIFTLGQSIRFRVYKDQDPLDLSLMKFFVNYTMLIAPILLGADLHKWVPFTPQKITADAWEAQMNKYIRMVRDKANMRRICELIQWSKYLTNLLVATDGDRLGLSISNNDFLTVAERSQDAYESMTSTFKIPDNCSPSELEAINKKRTSQLNNIIAAQSDLPISTYARNTLFNLGQFREFAVHIGYKPDLMDHTIPMTHQTNIIMGLKDPTAFMTDAYGGRKAEVLKLNVSDAGAFERSLTMLLSGVRKVDTEYECDSRHFRTRFIESADTLDKLDGRVATMDPKSDEFFIIDPLNDSLVGKTLYIKTPITCTHPDRDKGVICSACYGKLMASLNCDVHIGRLAGLNQADDIEQKLLSAKHALATDTADIEFDGIFENYFNAANCRIGFSSDFVSNADTETLDHLSLEFHLNAMTKLLDGEGRHYDRMVMDITIYDDRDDSRTVIQEKNGSPLYLSPEFVNGFFLDAAKHHAVDQPVYVPFNELIDGKLCCDTLFEYQYQNNGISKPLFELQSILQKTNRINAFANYDDCLDHLIPLFIAGGIHLPELQSELLVSQLIYGKDGKPVDWDLEKPEYQFYTIDKAIHSSNSVITSILYQESSMQLAGGYDAYKKTGTSAYDIFLYDKN